MIILCFFFPKQKYKCLESLKRTGWLHLKVGDRAIALLLVTRRSLCSGSCLIASIYLDVSHTTGKVWARGWHDIACGFMQFPHLVSQTLELLLLLLFSKAMGCYRKAASQILNVAFRSHNLNPIAHQVFDRLCVFSSQNAQLIYRTPMSTSFAFCPPVYMKEAEMAGSFS